MGVIFGPYDGPYRRDVLQRYGTNCQRDQCAERGAPTYTESFGLPDDMNEGQDEYSNSDNH